MPTAVHIFGIRHHGPGSARSLRAALERLSPNCILVEGPPDAAEVLPLLAHAEMKPPVALLVYVPETPRLAVYYPFAEFSPEWQAIRYGLHNNVPVRFMDLPQAHRLAPPEDPQPLAASRPPTADEPETAAEPPPAPQPDASTPAPAPPETPDPAALRRDPLAALAQAAGYDDSERWWDHLVENRRRDAGDDVFPAILEAMSALRENAPAAAFPDDPRREAYMRQTIRAAMKEGFERIAVVCGAWHAPVLVPEKMPPAKDDAATLKGLPKAKTAATWVPWTHGRLTFASGYGAGVQSPGWYQHLWRTDDQVATRWMTKVARLLREQDLDCSSAHVIESVRLAETLAALRGRPLPGLYEMNEAARAVFCGDAEAPMQLVAEKLIVGETMGEVPDGAPAVPLQQDVQREQKRLRLPPEPSAKQLELDLRKPNDLDRSRLLHRLNLLGLAWGKVERSTGKGTFKENWRLKWEPEFAVVLIEAGAWGNTVADAAAAKVIDAAEKATGLPGLTSLLNGVLLAELPDAVARLMHRIETEAAVASDVNHLMDALPPLANVLRYGNVRGTDLSAVGHVVDGLVARVCIGLYTACAALDDDAAGEMYGRVVAVNAAIGLLENAEHAKQWHDALAKLTDASAVHGLVAGRAARLRLDAGRLTPEEAAKQVSLALSVGIDPARAGAWVDGFLRGSGQILLHDPKLFAPLDAWVSSLSKETFDAVLPLLRRTFSTFEKPERRMLGERVKQGSGAGGPRGAEVSADIDPARAELVLPVVALLLGSSDGR